MGDFLRPDPEGDIPAVAFAGSATVRGRLPDAAPGIYRIRKRFLWPIDTGQDSPSDIEIDAITYIQITG